VCGCVCVCERECVSVCERESVGVCVSVSVWVCVCERECVGVCMCVGVCWFGYMTPAGIEPAAFRFVTQYLNSCATAVL